MWACRLRPSKRLVLQLLRPCTTNKNGSGASMRGFVRAVRPLALPGVARKALFWSGSRLPAWGSSAPLSGSAQQVDVHTEEGEAKEPLEEAQAVGAGALEEQQQHKRTEAEQVAEKAKGDGEAKEGKEEEVEEGEEGEDEDLAESVFVRRVQVQNLPPWVSTLRLRQTFAKYGPVESVLRKFNPQTGIPTGKGVITFTNASAAQKVLSEFKYVRISKECRVQIMRDARAKSVQKDRLQRMRLRNRRVRLHGFRGFFPDVDEDKDGAHKADGGEDEVVRRGEMPPDLVAEDEGDDTSASRERRDC